MKTPVAYPLLAVGGEHLLEDQAAEVLDKDIVIVDVEDVFVSALNQEQIDMTGYLFGRPSRLKGGSRRKTFTDMSFKASNLET